jgi:hypothetical protein
MKKILGIIVIFCWLYNTEGHSQAVRLFPGNNRYLEFHGKPIVLITSAEHYGAVINAAFDYKKYLSELEKEGFNYTRIFTGTYLEPTDNIFGIKNNNLAPGAGLYVSPWILNDGKYNLEQFNNEYFVRLKDFIREACQKNIIVEITLFSSIYDNSAWRLCPFYFKNNSNGLDSIPFYMANTVFNKDLLKYQISFVKKLIGELNEYDNLFYEIQNEPWSDNPCLVNYVNLSNNSVFPEPWQTKVEIANPVSLHWQQEIATTIIETEKALKKQHLIAENISNFEYAVDQPVNNVSILNFHYATSRAVSSNLAFSGVKSLDETGFMPHRSELYLEQAWRFVLAGGGIYNNLDYSFITGNEEGNWPIPDSNPGWGGPAFREQLHLLVKFMHAIPFHEMKFCDSLVVNDTKVMQVGMRGRDGTLGMLLGDVEDRPLQLDIKPGNYAVEWWNIFTGEIISKEITVVPDTQLISPFSCKTAALVIRTR